MEKINEFEAIVPPLNLCKKIPEGEFSETALVWEITLSIVYHDGDLLQRNTIHERRKFNFLEPTTIKSETHPAPTLAEIMKKLPFGTIVFMDAPETFAAISYGGTLQAKVVKDTTPEIAALRLWFKLKGIEV